MLQKDNCFTHWHADGQATLLAFPPHLSGDPGPGLNLWRWHLQS